VFITVMATVDVSETNDLRQAIEAVVLTRPGPRLVCMARIRNQQANNFRVLSFFLCNFGGFPLYRMRNVRPTVNWSTHGCEFRLPLDTAAYLVSLSRQFLRAMGVRLVQRAQ